VDDQRIGAALRALRRRRGLRQADVARITGLAQSTVSRIERGHLDALSLRALRAAFGALDARLVARVLWRGGEIDRVLDERHAELVGTVARHLQGLGWTVLPEVTFSVYGERGSIDILAGHAATREVLVTEIKPTMASIEEMLRRHDAKVRLAGEIAAKRFGWKPAGVSRLLVLADTSQNRRAVARHAAVLDTALPDRGWAVRRWLAKPVGRLSGLWFLSPSHGRTARRRRGSG
jgi:transcriptional regulator with XRE-family HTH domain